MVLMMCKGLSKCFIFTTYSFNCVCVRERALGVGAWGEVLELKTIGL